ncbi:EamA family transporter RarD [Novosphingobium sp. KACC 22771]|uniref:EamA family transporter RarD n=1 Tax=Novosphingobium sp. KACC 22771 TaxID=3025670 RepID=UPI002365C8CC|nr:EamA family transporter RarD [Novosphingobium sp. KACC 22771]WDF73726.1 EamA family transporter RarD [Novosphingobium sp. KACC 22771]
MMQPETRNDGMPYAIAAYLIWGLLPLYLRQVHDVPPFEFVGWRTLFTLPACALAIIVLRQGAALRAALSEPRKVLALAASALLIGGNWTTYVVMIQQGHIFAASLGYYINPLMNVVLGTFLLNERLNRAQWVAVALAAVGVVILASGAAETLGWSLALAATFSGYGLVRKKAPVPALPGLAIEAGLLALPAVAMIALGHGPLGITLGQGRPMHDGLVAMSGVVTAVPLVLFAMAAQRMNYSILGFVQFLAPTLVFFEGLLLFHEPLQSAQLGAFILIWAALAVFSWDMWRRR